ncbi:MAG: rRNA maturation RNase YbeY [bacterium]
MTGDFSITNRTNGKLPRLPFEQVKDAILGPKYSLSVALVTPKESHKLNLTYRQKDKPTNVLSFPFGKNSGELVLDLKTSRADAVNFDMTPDNFLLFLVIHGMLHLKGYDHGSTMEKAEKKFLKKFL